MNKKIIKIATVVVTSMMVMTSAVAAPKGAGNKPAPKHHTSGKLDGRSAKPATPVKPAPSRKNNSGNNWVYMPVTNGPHKPSVPPPPPDHRGPRDDHYGKWDGHRDYHDHHERHDHHRHHGHGGDTLHTEDWIGIGVGLLGGIVGGVIGASAW